MLCVCLRASVLSYDHSPLYMFCSLLLTLSRAVRSYGRGPLTSCTHWVYRSTGNAMHTIQRPWVHKGGSFRGYESPGLTRRRRMSPDPQIATTPHLASPPYEPTGLSHTSTPSSLSIAEHLLCLGCPHSHRAHPHLQLVPAVAQRRRRHWSDQRCACPAQSPAPIQQTRRPDSVGRWD